MLAVFFSWLWYWLYMCRLSELGIEVRSVLRGRGQGSSQLSGSTQLSSKETFISKSEAKTISEINNICEVISLFMFCLFIQSLTTYCKMWCLCYFPRNLFVLLLTQSRGLLWTIIHGVMQLAFNATRKLIYTQNRSHVHVANIMIELWLGHCNPFPIFVPLIYASF